uniref:NADH-ubiquinone oxidoreductase chain 5 n=1 Tax=Austropallene bucera TaxID=2992010 RepID=A0A9E7V4D6_9CHEL|nr:NADH dehydrogenase subunit 5 [Austropallene bucera]UYX57730.1 NADH dehydrogenase subunit 5 [Austropallene bucera]
MMIFYIYSFFLLILSILQIYFFMFVSFYGMSYIVDINIMSMNSIIPMMSFIIDIYSLSFSSFVCVISSSVFLFSTMYMSGDKYLIRFFMLLMMFISSMIMLIYSGNLLTSLLGWDGLGFVSYVLVVYYPNKLSLSGGMMTIMTNRLGDSFMLLSVSMMMIYSNWELVFSKFTLFMLILAAMTKSAQFPFSAWLPAAMAAPTPVSSLVHSSTLVTAGVYILFRFSSYICVEVWEMLCLCSILTMFLAGISAFFEYDLKKIIALSTLSQLGVMMFSMSMGLKYLAFFHLIIHAFFKALMFLSGGSLMHGYSGSQDIRYMGSMSFMNPYINGSLIFSSFCLGAFPFLASFYSKHLILDSFLFGDYNFILLMVLYISNSLTLFYSVRLILFLSSRYYNYNSLVVLCENYDIMFSLTLLIIFAFFGGFFLLSFYLNNSLVMFNFGYEKYLMNFMLPMSIFLSFLILKFIYSYLILSIKFLNWFLGGMWFISFFTGQFMLLLTKSVSNLFINFLEYGWGEFYGPQGLGNLNVNIVSYFNLKQFKIMEFYNLNFLFWMMLIPLL